MNPIFLRLKEKGLRYWTTAVIVFILSFVGTPYVYDFLDLASSRAKYFQFLLESGPRSTIPKFVTIVLIQDDEYWLGKPAGRRPIKRDYLATLVDRLTQANAKVIALDIDARLPNPDSMEIPKEYQEETKIFVEAILKAAKLGTKVVLSAALWINDSDEYITDSDIYQAYGLCGHKEGQTAHGEPDPDARKNITCGYISLPDDPLVVPLQIRMADGSYLDSFGLAVARAINPNYVGTFLTRVGSSTRYSNYISGEKFASSHATYSAHDVLQPESKNSEFRGSAVIIGGNWSSFAARRGGSVDEHWTPVGSVVGAELHANFAEDILDDRTFGTSPAWFIHIAEAALGVLAAASFALVAPFWRKLGGVLGLLIVVLLIQWLVLQLLGVFFDAFVPILALGLHALYDRLFEDHPRAVIVDGARKIH